MKKEEANKDEQFYTEIRQIIERRVIMRYEVLISAGCKCIGS